MIVRTVNLGHVLRTPRKVSDDDRGGVVDRVRLLVRSTDLGGTEQDSGHNVRVSALELRPGTGTPKGRI